ncbi:cell wall-active antibiotics response protein [Candidatus Bipolaricaulota bacterium]|nr:cell wall-active antibiotics response protein [Candidatus Bipolaricaulota bacterium]
MLVIVLGLDLLLGRPSLGAALGTVVFACLALVIGAGLFHVFAPNAWTAERHSFSHPAADATSATITLACERCAITIEGAASAEQLIEGEVTVRRDERLDQTSSLDALDGNATFSLTSEGRFPFGFATSRESLPWEVRLDPELPLSIRVATAGTLELDLRPFLASAIDVTARELPCALWLPDRVDSTTYLSGDDIAIRVPDGVGVRIHGATDIQITTSGDFVQREAGLESADYDRSAVRADILVRPGTGTITVKPAVSDDQPERQSI